MIEAYGGREAALKLGAPGAAPAPLRRNGPADGGS